MVLLAVLMRSGIELSYAVLRQCLSRAGLSMIRVRIAKDGYFGLQPPDPRDLVALGLAIVRADCACECGVDTWRIIEG